ncbi:iron complex transport system ATP-binding protein [Amycolatopsis xylanica]|uniref:Iron complex transport system ATP-binding protein n=1 Tax=Amycolatopsis xylanica TaxID=589385 RepID=A0A1H2W814_9PSEU|nr:ABC transporter ATP-binding protein [Amycolatopsis xylanica]SDW76697.1 iron complex transport system ATP-binding protein [Amycolatopsis xylanica]
MTGLLLRGVGAGYAGKLVVRGVDGEVPDGGWLTIIGPNGAGKSTLLKAVAGLLPHVGEIRAGARPLRALPARERARLIGYAPQTPQLPDGLSVTDYVLLGRTPHLGFLAREGRRDLQLVSEALERLDLGALAARPLHALSGGERQRAVLARVLAQQPRVLLLDEPTTGLDIGHAQALLELVDRLRAEDGTTVIATVHDLTFAAQYADRLLLLNGGSVVASGTPSAVLTAPAVREHYAADAEILTTSGGELVVAPSRALNRGPSS